MVQLASLFVLLAGSMFLSEPPTPEQSRSNQSFVLGGAVARPGEWTVDRLRAEFPQSLTTIKHQRRDGETLATCLPLLTLIEHSQPKFDEARKNHRLAFVIVVEASDGYTVSFSLGELLEQYGDKKVYLAIEQDRRPLPSSEQPVRLIVVGDKRPSRSMHAISRITVLDGNQETRTDSRSGVLKT